MSITIHCDTLTEAHEITGLMFAGFSEMGEISDIAASNTDVFVGESNEKYQEWYKAFDEDEPYDEEDDDNEG